MQCENCGSIYWQIFAETCEYYSAEYDAKEDKLMACYMDNTDDFHISQTAICEECQHQQKITDTVEFV